MVFFVAPGMLHASMTMKDLNDLIVPSSEWTLIDADAINENGWILCNGRNAGETARNSPEDYP